MLAVVQGPPPHGDQYRTIVYKGGATKVVHDHASIKRLTAYSKACCSQFVHPCR